MTRHVHKYLGTFAEMKQLTELIKAFQNTVWSVAAARPHSGVKQL